jgi:N,N'-diacetyllegionaminate synthase
MPEVIIPPFFRHDSPCFIIAEAGVNHNADLGLAKQLIQIAALSGADAVKFQTFNAKNLVMHEAAQAEYQTHNSGIKETQYSMLKRLELPLAAFAELYECCEKSGIMFMSTPFDQDSSDYLSTLGMQIFKISSGELTNLPFLRHIAKYQRPIILSTGMGTLEEVRDAVAVIRAAGNDRITVLQCTSNYPAAPDTVNLRAMQTLHHSLGVPVGYSDHTMGIEAAVIAVAAGAKVIEKHFTLDCSLPGPDHKASLEPHDLKVMVQNIRRAEVLLGSPVKAPCEAELAVAKVVRRSLVTRCAIPAGSIIHESMLELKRPGTGIPPAKMHELIGRRVVIDLAEGTLFKWEDLA